MNNLHSIIKGRLKSFRRPLYLFAELFFHADFGFFLEAVFLFLAAFAFLDTVAQADAAQRFFLRFVFRIFIRVFRNIVLNSERRALQIEGFAECLGQIACVAV